MQVYGYKCVKCGTEEAPNWITEKVSTMVETNNKGLLTFENRTQTFIFCPECYEEEAINAI